MAGAGGAFNERSFDCRISSSFDDPGLLSGSRLGQRDAKAARGTSVPRASLGGSGGGQKKGGAFGLDAGADLGINSRSTAVWLFSGGFDSDVGNHWGGSAVTEG